MKRLLVLILATCILLGLAACAKPATQDPTTPTTVPTTTPTTAPTTSPTTTPTTAPTTPPVPTTYDPTKIWMDNATKEGVPAFFKLLSEQLPDEVNVHHAKEDSCYNITPPGADAKTNLQVFASTQRGLSYIVQDGKITARVSIMDNLLFCDLDKDGKQDIIYMTLVGSGNTYAHVGVYNTTTQKSIPICKSLKGYPTNVLWLAASGADVYFEGKTEADNKLQYPILSLEAVYENGKLSGYAVTGIYGSVVYQDGQYQFVPYKK